MVILVHGYSCGFHTGVDFPASGTVESNPDLYACMPRSNSLFIYTRNARGFTAIVQHYGNQVQILGQNLIYYRYCHLKYGTIPSNLQVGDNVDQNTFIGKMGNTGNSTGTHLHLEASTTQSWNCDTFLTPRRQFAFWK